MMAEYERSFHRPRRFVEQDWEEDVSSMAESYGGEFNDEDAAASEKGKRGLIISYFGPKDYLFSILNPHSRLIRNWNKFFVVACICGLFVDPLIFFIFGVNGHLACMSIHWTYAVILTILRSATDLVYFIHIILQFRVAFSASVAEVGGRRVLITSRRKIAVHYLKGGFIVDLFAVLPLPQLVIWVVLPMLDERSEKEVSIINHFKTYILIVTLLQYVPRVLRITPLIWRMEKATGFIFETASSSFLINLLVLLLASHIVGSMWYLLAIQRLDACMRHHCGTEASCVSMYLDCPITVNRFPSSGYEEYNLPELGRRQKWLESSTILAQCFEAEIGDRGVAGEKWEYGIYAEALPVILSKATPITLYFRCFFWGLQNLSNLADILAPSSTSASELLFCIAIIIAGLLLFALLVGNMQGFLHSLNNRKDEMRLKRQDMEQWMQHIHLPSHLAKRVRDYQRHKWAATRGVCEEEILEDLPEDLRFDIRRQLCIDLIQKVPLFAEMGDSLQKEIFKRLKIQLFVKRSTIVREGDPVKSMFFVLRGVVEQSAVHDTRTNVRTFAGYSRQGDVIGQEILDHLSSWRTTEEDGRQVVNGRVDDFLSPYTLTCVDVVEAFKLSLEDIKHILECLWNKPVQARVTLSPPPNRRVTWRQRSFTWRVWAAIAIQRAWRSRLRRRRSEQSHSQRQSQSQIQVNAPTSRLVQNRGH